MPDRSTSRWSVLVPAAALLVGLLIGGVVVGVADGGDDAPAAAPEPVESPIESASTDPSEDAATTVVVPSECLAAVDTVEQVVDLVRQTTTAVREFRTDELRSLLRDLEALDLQAREQVQGCRDVRTETSPSAE